MLEIQEKQLLDRILAGERNAIRKFYVIYSPSLLRFIRRKIDSEGDVEEIAQDVLFAFLDGARDFTGQCSINTYLCSIAKNKIIDFYRKAKIKKIVFSQLPPQLEPLLLSMADNPENKLEKSLRSQRIARVFGNLSPRYATLLKLKYVEGRSVEEIARVLTCSFKSVESMLFRARKAFVKNFVSV